MNYLFKTVIFLLSLLLISCSSKSPCDNYLGRYEFVKSMGYDNFTYTITIEKQEEKYLITYQENGSRAGLMKEQEYLASCDNGLLVALHNGNNILFKINEKGNTIEFNGNIFGKLDKEVVNSQDDKEDFYEFYNEFRKAVSYNNKSRVIELTHFPFWDFFSGGQDNWTDESRFARYYEDEFNKRENKFSIQQVSLNGESTNISSVSNGSATLKEETDEEVLGRMRKGFKLSKKARVYTLSLSYDINPSEGISGFNNFYFGETNDGFKLIGAGIPPDAESKNF